MKRDLKISAGIFLVFLVLYAFTAQRGVSWQDSGEFQYRALVGDYIWNSGVARAHPLYVLMARICTGVFPAGMKIWAINAFSGIGMALAVAVLAGVVRRLTGEWRAGVIAAMTLGLAQMTWWMGSMAEVYSWSLAFIMMELYLVVRYFEGRRMGWLVALMGVNGLHLAVHNVAFLSLAVYGVVVLREVLGRLDGGWGRRIRWLVLLGVIWLLGAGMVMEQVGREMVAEGIGAGVRSLLFGDIYRGQVLGIGAVNWRLALANYALAAVSVANPVWLLALVGLRKWRGGEMRWVLVALTALHGLFWVRYFVADQATFVLPLLGMLGVWVGVGSSKILKCGSSGVERGKCLSALVPECLSGEEGCLNGGVGGSGDTPTEGGRRGSRPSKGVGGSSALCEKMEGMVRHSPEWQEDDADQEIGVPLGEGFLRAQCVGKFEGKTEGLSLCPFLNLFHNLWSVKETEKWRVNRVLVMCLLLGVVVGVGVPVGLVRGLEWMGVEVVRGREVPFRSEFGYWLLPWKSNEGSAERFVAEVERIMEDGDVLIADATTAAPLMAARAAGRLRGGWMLSTPWENNGEKEVGAWLEKSGGRMRVVSPVAGYVPRWVLEKSRSYEVLKY